MNQYQPPKPDHTIRNIALGIIIAAAAIAVGLWVLDLVQTEMFIADCASQGGVAKVWTITGQKFCDLP